MQLKYTYRGRDIETLTEPELREALRKSIDALRQERAAALTASALDCELAEMATLLRERRM